MMTVRRKRSKGQLVKHAMRDENQIGSLQFRVYRRDQSLIQNPQGWGDFALAGEIPKSGNLMDEFGLSDFEFFHLEAGLREKKSKHLTRLRIKSDDRRSRIEVAL